MMQYQYAQPLVSNRMSARLSQPFYVDQVQRSSMQGMPMQIQFQRGNPMQQSNIAAPEAYAHPQAMIYPLKYHVVPQSYPAQPISSIRQQPYVNIQPIIANAPPHHQTQGIIDINAQQNIAPMKRRKHMSSNEGLNVEMNSLSEGDAIMAGPYIGVIRYLGPLYSKKKNGSKINKTKKKYIGIECTELPPNTIGHNGWYKDFRYFHTQFGANNGILVPSQQFTKKLSPQFLLETIKQQFTSALQLQDREQQFEQEINLLKLNIQSLLMDKQQTAAATSPHSRSQTINQISPTLPSSPPMQSPPMQPGQYNSFNQLPRGLSMPVQAAYPIEQAPPYLYDGDVPETVTVNHSQIQPKIKLEFHRSAPGPWKGGDKQEHKRTGFGNLLLKKKHYSSPHPRRPSRKFRRSRDSPATTDTSLYSDYEQDDNDNDNDDSDDGGIEQVPCFEDCFDDVDSDGNILPSIAPLMEHMDSDEILTMKLEYTKKYTVDLPAPNSPVESVGSIVNRNRKKRSDELRKLEFLNKSSNTSNTTSITTDSIQYDHDLLNDDLMMMKKLKNHLANYATPRVSVMSIPENFYDSDPLEQSMIQSGLVMLTPQLGTQSSLGTDQYDSDYKLGDVPLNRPVNLDDLNDSDSEHSMAWSESHRDGDSDEESAVWALADDHLDDNESQNDEDNNLDIHSLNNSEGKSSLQRAQV